ncbi:MAG TPA: ankyrin repeat domain-containing protein [Burkholderiaceae bacterium]|nr:ankyrin repeat domain-containing protein [Burkholderiaceae bacterium]
MKLAPVFVAVMKDDVPAVRALLESGVDPNSRDRDARTPLMYAVVDGKLNVFGLLATYPGVDLNAQDKSGNSALHFAAQDYRVAEAETLLKLQARVDARDSYGNTPLWRAVFNSQGRGEIIRLLLAHGADPNSKNDKGKSPIDAARVIANFDVAQHFKGE